MSNETPQTNEQAHTPPKKEKKRYENESQILEDINNVRYRMLFLRQEAEICEKMAVIMRDYPEFPTVGMKKNNCVSKNIFSLVDYRRRIELNGSKVSVLENKKLKKLGEALSQMRSGVLPEIVDDESVERPF